ncbi:unnamed protein product [Gongylonema pulchrum]|uniref:Recep_L_domain domain-containing protein n=1 Tax=Gongylonema pulchrum TaxID=637853 RepID=A0A183F1G9_9BILA|nr:unnamed protein product [Gongylonema pulchrum]
MDRLDQISIALETAGISLKAALNLLHLITSLDGNPLTLDGTILNNTEQVIDFLLYKNGKKISLNMLE